VAGALPELFSKLTHGVYVIGVSSAGRRNAFTAAWVMQVSFDPPMLALSISPSHSSYALLSEGGAFTVNVLGAEQVGLAAHFGRSASTDKLAAFSWRASRSGSPILEAALAWFECELGGDHPVGDHHLVLGTVLAGGLQSGSGEPMNYRDTGGLDGSAALFPRDFPERR
jgi:flavin reductase (DIM6/NTAB) family NADH-FMN oxidoreductase RutF